MNQDLEGHARRVHTEQRFCKDEVTGAGDREELGEPLYEAQSDRLQQRHCFNGVWCGRVRTR